MLACNLCLPCEDRVHRSHPFSRTGARAPRRIVRRYAVQNTHPPHALKYVNHISRPIRPTALRSSSMSFRGAFLATVAVSDPAAIVDSADDWAPSVCSSSPSPGTFSVAGGSSNRLSVDLGGSTSSSDVASPASTPELANPSRSPAYCSRPFSRAIYSLSPSA